MEDGRLRPGQEFRIAGDDVHAVMFRLDGTIVVTLSAEMMRYAACRGVERQIDNILSSRRQAHGHDPRNDWQSHINGALGELAVAVFLGVHWDGAVGDLDALDVGRYQVRTTPYPNGRLILHPGDWLGDAHILVTGINRQFVLQGWIYGSEGQQERFWQAPRRGRPAYFVPQNELHPMNELPKEGRV